MSHDPYSGQPHAGAPQPSSSSNTKVILIIVALVVVVGAIPCIGIIAAISIPAFLRYIKVSKTAEAEVTIARMQSEVEMYVMEHCEFPPELQPHADISECSGGAKCLPTRELPEFWVKAGDLNQPTYFVYSAIMEDGDMVLRAEADFNVGSPVFHTHTLQMSLNECAVEASPVYVTNEFE